MAVGAFTNANGTHYNQVIVEDYDVGWTKDSGSFLRLHPFSFQRNYAKKDYPYSPGRHHTVKGFRLPSSYGRKVRNVVIDQPTIREIASFDGDEQTGQAKYVRHLGSRVELGEMTDGYYADMHNALAKANTECRLKLKSNRMQLGAEIAQAKLTLELLAGTASQLAQSVLAAKRGQWGRIPGILGIGKKDLATGKSIANRWLEYQYGWRPLMGTCHSLALELMDGIKRPLILSASKTVPVNRQTDSYQGPIKVHSSEYGTGTVRYWASVNDSFKSGVEEAGLINPLSVAWELVPFSFVIDWFVPIGNVLESMTATMGLEFIAGFEANRGSCYRTFEDYGPDPFRTQKGLLAHEYFEFRRAQLNGFVLPALYGNENPFSSAHVANAAALIRQLWR